MKHCLDDCWGICFMASPHQLPAPSLLTKEDLLPVSASKNFHICKHPVLLEPKDSWSQQTCAKEGWQLSYHVMQHMKSSFDYRDGPKSPWLTDKSTWNIELSYVSEHLWSSFVPINTVMLKYIYSTFIIKALTTWPVWLYITQVVQFYFTNFLPLSVFWLSSATSSCALWCH